ncbi:MAG: type IV pilus assembly protein PilM [Candidatus Paceibacterota bacterium]|jgi:type IV pilus assembly protein PilM
MLLFGKRKNQFGLGVDIGTKGIKMVEVSKKKGRIVLENYGEVNLDVAGKQFFRYFDKNTLNPSVENITRAIRAILSESEIKTEKAVFSLPDFATFFITFELPSMTKKELDSAVGFEARKYIPLPLSEVVLDWQVFNRDLKEGVNKVLMMAIPKVLVEHYKHIAEQSGLELVALEAEAVALKRALVKDTDPISCLVEMGFQSTNVTIVDSGLIKTSFSFDIAGKDLTLTMAETLGMDFGLAENLKIKNGLSSDNDEAATVLASVLTLIIEKVKKVIRDFQVKENKKVEQLILSGGTSRMTGIVDYFQEIFNYAEFGNIKVNLGEPFNDVVYPPVIEKRIRRSNPVFAIALGEALKKFEK